MAALHTTVELGGWLIATPGLEKPPERFMVATLRAFNLRCGERIEFGFLVSDDLDLGGVGELFLRLLHHCVPLLFGVTAIVADVCYRHFMGAFDLLQFEPSAALRAEFQLEAPPSAFATSL